ncbi:MAG: hypothetical protein AAB542_03785 [Patescibacteria group bacterium]
MQELKHKIQHTTLFSDEDKIAILAAVDTYSADDVKALEAIIDEFDTKHQEAVSEYKKSVYGVLDTIVAKASFSDKKRFQNATSDIRTGVEALLQ